MTDTLYTIPQNWRWTTLKNVAEIKGGKRLPKGKNLVENKTAHPYIRVTDFFNHTVKFDEVKYIEDDTQNLISRYTISSNDIYISIAGSIGKVGIIPFELDGANLTENAAKITDLKNIIQKFLMWWLSYDVAQNQIKNFTKSTTQSKLALFRIEQIKIPLPPLAEQKRIVERLDSLFAKLDAAKKILQDIVDGYELRRAAILHHAFTGKLTADFRKKNNLSLDDWQEKTLGEIAEIIMGQSPKGDSTTMDSKYTPLIGGAADIGELFPKISRYTKTPTKLTTTEDIIICIRATLGKPIFSDGVYCLGRGVAAIRPHSILKNFLRYVFINFEQYFYDNAAGSTFLQIPSTKLKNFPIPVPPLAEQKEIARLLDIFITKENCVKEIAEKTLQQIDALKKNILARAFRGELGTNNPSEITC